jgi:hypothetical protein
MSAAVEFLFTEMDLAQTFLNIADTSSNLETVEHSRRKARKACDTVLRLLPKCKTTPIESLALQDKLAALRSRLESSSQSNS